MQKIVGCLSIVLLSAGCTVYAPMQPAAPQLRARGQGEVSGTSFLNNRWEGAAAYSPVRYVTVRVAGGFRPDQRDTTYFRGRQFEAGLGGYYPLGKRWLLTGMGGYGRAKSIRGFYDFELFTSGRLTQYKARYHKAFGELAISYRADWITIGLAYRLTKVGFESLTDNGVPIDLHQMTRSEPLLFARVGNEAGALRGMQLQFGVGTSTVPGGTREQYSYESSAQRNIKDGKLFTTIGLVFYPHRLRRAE